MRYQLKILLVPLANIQPKMDPPLMFFLGIFPRFSKFTYTDSVIKLGFKKDVLT